MAGFGPWLNAIGAGLGMGVNDLMQQRQREQQMQMQQLGMQRQLMLLNNYLQEQKSKDVLGSALGGGLGDPFGGLYKGSGSSTSPAMGGASLPGVTMPQTGGGGGGFRPMPSSMGAAGEYGVGQSTDPMQLLSGRIAALGVPQPAAEGAVNYMNRNESRLDPAALNPTSGALGVGQWLGPRKAALTSQYGPQPDLMQQADFLSNELQSGADAGGTLPALQQATTAQQGYDIWGRNFERPGAAALAKAGVGAGGGTRVEPLSSMAEPARQSTGFMQEVPGSQRPFGPGEAEAAMRDLSQGQMPGQQAPQQRGQQFAQLQAPDPDAYMQRMEAFKQQLIDRGARPADADAYARQRMKEALDRDYRRFEMDRQIENDAARRRGEDRSVSAQERANELAGKGNPEALNVKQPDGSFKPGMVTYNKRTGQYLDQRGRPVEVEPLPTKAGGGPGGAGEHLQAFDTEGKMVFEGNAHYVPGTGWQDDATQKPIKADRFVTLPRGAGGAAGRAGAQVQRQIIAAREIASDLQNVVQLPITTTRGIFGGRQQGPGLMDALKENLAEKLTSEDAELANSALASLERELSVVVSPVYGGAWAADSFKPLALKEGQTNLVKLYNIARMRQTADNALEGVVNTDWVGKDQKAYAQQLMGVLEKAVPWTPADVMAYRKQTDDRMSFGDYVKQQHMGGAAQGGGGGGPQPGHVEDGFRFKGGNPGDASNWEKVTQ